jgi:hypothetical protein
LYKATNIQIYCIAVTIQSRVAIGGLLFGKDSVVGLGARPGRAGSIGRDTSAHEEFIGPPPQEAGGASPCPIHEEITALYIKRKRVIHRRGGLTPYGGRAIPHCG